MSYFKQKAMRQKPLPAPYKKKEKKEKETSSAKPVSPITSKDWNFLWKTNWNEEKIQELITMIKAQPLGKRREQIRDLGLTLKNLKPAERKTFTAEQVWFKANPRAIDFEQDMANCILTPCITGGMECPECHQNAVFESQRSTTSKMNSNKSGVVSTKCNNCPYVVKKDR